MQQGLKSPNFGRGARRVPEANGSAGQDFLVTMCSFCALSKEEVSG